MKLLKEASVYKCRNCGHYEIIEPGDQYDDECPECKCTSWTDIVLEYFPNLSDQEANLLLFNKTSYPCTSNVFFIRRQLDEFSREGGLKK